MSHRRMSLSLMALRLNEVLHIKYEYMIYMFYTFFHKYVLYMNPSYSSY